jgi:hypothetical protein
VAELRARYVPERKNIAALLFSHDPEESASAIVGTVIAVTWPLLVPVEWLERFIRWNLARLRTRRARRTPGRAVADYDYLDAADLTTTANRDAEPL